MAIVITGGTGHIGNNLIRLLIKNNEKVKILSRRYDKSIDDYKSSIIIGNILNEDFLMNNINEGDIVIHLAGMIDIKNNKKTETLKVNFEGTKSILDISIKRKAKQFIYFSTTDCINTEGLEEIFEPNDIDPNKFKDSYGKSKALATKYVMDKRKEGFDIRINILYPSAVIGVNDFKPSYLGKVVTDIIDGKMQFGIKGGYNFVDVDDVVNATYNLIINNLEGDYLLTGKKVSIIEFYKTVNKVLERKKHTVKIPTFIVYPFILFIPYLSKFVLKTILSNANFNNTRMKEILNVDNTEFDETINKTVNFFSKER